MNNPRVISASEDNDLRAKFKAKEWIPISARFASRCKHCGGQIGPGTAIVWNKALSKVMHYNPCAMEWLETQPASGSAAPTTGPAPVSVSIGGKKFAPMKVEPAAPAAPAAPQKTAAELILEEAKRKEEEKKRQEEEEAKKQEEVRKAETAQKIAGMTSKEKKNVNEPRKPGFVRITLPGTRK